jgi:hypothetical protein
MQRATDLAIDALGDIVVTVAQFSVSSGQDYITVKCDGRGNPLWVASYDGSGSGSDIASAMAIDNANHVFVTGVSRSASGSYDCVTIEYDSAGTLIWSAVHDGPAYGYALALDTTGNLYVGASSAGIGTGADLAVIKYVQGPQVYCESSTTTHGCRPSIGASGVPSTSASQAFSITCSGGEGQVPGILFYGTKGPIDLPWSPLSTSVLCVAVPPLQRTLVQQSGGTAGACDGAYSIDFLAFLASNPGALGQPIAPGEHFNAQWWFRDPLAPGGTNLSNAIAFDLVP